MKQFLAAIIAALPFWCTAQPSVTHTVPRQVAVFISSECPISQKYIATLNEIYRKYGDEPSLQWQFVLTDKIKRKELQAFVREYNVGFPLVKDDSRNSWSAQFMASVTPQVVIKDDEVLYSGAIDNWFYGLGQYRQVITEHYFIDALDRVLNGEIPSIRQTEAVGCPIAKLPR